MIAAVGPAVVDGKIAHLPAGEALDELVPAPFGIVPGRPLRDRPPLDLGQGLVSGQADVFLIRIGHLALGIQNHVTRAGGLDERPEHLLAVAQGEEGPFRCAHIAHGGLQEGSAV
jgi:hypothetical protein